MTTSNMELVVGALVGTALVSMMLCFMVFYLRRKYIPGIPNVKLIASVNPEYVSTGKISIFIQLIHNIFKIGPNI